MREQLRELLKRAEIKRIGERITKKELCDIYGINYNFYMNCVSDRNLPSKNMVDDLLEYLEAPTQSVYARVFSSRKAEFEFHDALDIDADDLKNMIPKLKQNNMFNLSEGEELSLFKHADAKDKWNKKFGGMFKVEEENVNELIASAKEKLMSLVANDNEDEADKVRMEIYELEGSISDIKRRRDSSRKTYVEELVKSLMQ